MTQTRPFLGRRKAGHLRRGQRDSQPGTTAIWCPTEHSHSGDVEAAVSTADAVQPEADGHDGRTTRRGIGMFE